MTECIHVVIADDSPTVRRVLAGYLRSEEGFRVVASVGDGKSAEEAVEKYRPDVITLDVDMPGTDGLTALRRIMGRFPTPTVMISGVGGRSAERTFHALENGAVDFILKHNPGTACDPEAQRREIVAKVRAAAAVRTVRTLETGLEEALLREPSGEIEIELPELEDRIPASSAMGAVVIGASTGGPVALRHLLAELPGGFPRPIVVVQHIPGSFIRVLAAQLSRHTSLEVRPAADGDALDPGRVLIAPGDVHLLLASDGRVHHHSGPPVHGHRPAIDVTMQSAARVLGSRTCGILMTGMGDDGAAGMVAIRLAGGRTFAQDEASSVVWGMPRRASEQGSVEHLGTPAEIAHRLTSLVAQESLVASPHLQGVSP